MILAVAPVAVQPGILERREVPAESARVALDDARRHLGQPDAANRARRAREIAGRHRRVEAEDLEQLRAAIAAERADAHLRHDGEQSALQRQPIARRRPLAAGLVERRDGLDGFVAEPRTCRRRAEGEERRELVRVASVAHVDDEAGAQTETAGNQRSVNRGRGEQRRQGRVRTVHAGARAVREQEQRAAALDGGAGFGRNGRQPILERARAAGRLESGIDRDRLEHRRGRQLRELPSRQDRRAQLDPHRTPRRLVDVAALRAEERRQGHDCRFPVRIHWGVRHLREALAEEVGEQARPRREHGGRRIVAHRSDRLVRFDGHRLEDQLDLLARAAEGALRPRQLVRRPLDFRERCGLEVHRLRELAHGVVDHPPVAPAESQAPPDLVRAHDDRAIEVDHQHVAGAETIPVDDLVLERRENPGLRRDGNQAVRGADDAGGTEAVAIHGGADEAAVAEGERRRPVPGLAEERLKLVEGADVRRQIAIALPRRRDQPRQRVRDAVALLPQQIHRIVERRRIRTVGGHGRVAPVDAVAADRRVVERARLHPRPVAGDRVDLAVVREQAERLRERPVGRRVGAVALMKHREARREPIVGQVRVELLERLGRHERLVDHGRFRERAHRQPETGAAGRALNAAAQLEERFVGAAPRLRERHDGLQDARRRAALRPQHRVPIGRHGAPDEHPARGRQLALDERRGGGPIVGVHEEHAERAGSSGGQPAALRGGEERPRNVGQDAAAVDRAERSRRTAVREAGQRRQTVAHDVTARRAAEPGHESNAARVVLHGLRLWQRSFDK